MLARRMGKKKDGKKENNSLSGKMLAQLLSTFLPPRIASRASPSPTIAQQRAAFGGARGNVVTADETRAFRRMLQAWRPRPNCSVGCSPTC